MRPIVFSKKTVLKRSPMLTIILGVIVALLAIGSYQFTQLLKPNLQITPNTIQNLQEVPSLIRHNHGIGLIAFNPRPNEAISLVSRSYDGMVKLWNLKNDPTELFGVHTDEGFGLALSSDGSSLVTVDDQNSVRLWDLTQVTKIFKIFQILKDSQAAHSLTFSPDGQILASGSSDDVIKLWNWKNKQLLRTLKVGDSGVRSMAFSSDGTILASLNDYGDMVKLWNWRNDTVIRTLSGSYLFLASSPDGQTLAVGSYEDGIQLWNWRDGTVSTIPAGQGPVAFSPDSQILASNTDNGTIQLWNRSDGRLIRSFRGREKDTNFLAFSPDGQMLVSLNGDRIKLWNQQDGTERLSIQVEKVSSVAFSPDSQTLVIGSTDKSIQLLPMNYQAKLARSLNVNLKNILSGTFSPDQQSLILMNSQRIKLIRLRDLQEFRSFQAELDKSMLAPGLSPDARILAAGTVDGSIPLRNLQNGKLTRTLSGGLKAVISFLTFSPDGQILANSFWYENKIQLWNVSNGRLMRTLEASHKVWQMAFSPDGQLLAAGNVQGEIQFWNPRTGKKLRTLKGHASRITAIAFSADGQTLASGSADKTIKLWRVKK